jgi:hypothetical protein
VKKRPYGFVAETPVIVSNFFLTKNDGLCGETCISTGCGKYLIRVMLFEGAGPSNPYATVVTWDGSERRNETT